MSRVCRSVLHVYTSACLPAYLTGSLCACLLACLNVCISRLQLCLSICLYLCIIQCRSMFVSLAVTRPPNMSPVGFCMSVCRYVYVCAFVSLCRTMFASRTSRLSACLSVLLYCQQHCDQTKVRCEKANKLLNFEEHERTSCE